MEVETAYIITGSSIDIKYMFLYKLHRPWKSYNFIKIDAHTHTPHTHTYIEILIRRKHSQSWILSSITAGELQVLSLLQL